MSGKLTVRQMTSQISIVYPGSRLFEFQNENEGHKNKAIFLHFNNISIQITTIMEALSRERCRDYRDDRNIQPMIKQELLKLADIQRGQILMGTARNVTTFGCFVDIGVEQDGLIHTTKMAGRTLNIGDRVNVSVTDVDVPRKRIQLKLESVL